MGKARVAPWTTLQYEKIITYYLLHMNQKNIEELKRLYQESRSLLTEYESKRPAFDKYVYFLHTQGVSQKQIGEYIGLTQQAVSAILQRVLKSL